MGISSFESLHQHTSSTYRNIDNVFPVPFLRRKKLFDEKWHQLRLLVTEEDVTLYVDDLEIETQSLEPPVGIFINGKTQVGKYVRKETTVPVSLSTSINLFS